MLAVFAFFFSRPGAYRGTVLCCLAGEGTVTSCLGEGTATCLAEGTATCLAGGTATCLAGGGTATCLAEGP